MPPKSSKKELQKASWYTCEKCDTKITHNQLATSHEKSCEEFGVKNEIFTTKTINESLPKEVDEPHSIYLQRFLFIPEAICNFCNLTMNCYVVIELNGNFYVRQAWPISDDHLDVVYCSSTDIKMEQKTSSSVKIYKLKGSDVKIANRIILKHEEVLDEVKDVERLLKAKLKDTIVHPSNSIAIQFLNKTFTFKIDKIEEQAEDDLADQLASMKLEESKFYLIQPSTSVTIKSSDVHEIEVKQRKTLEDVGGMEEIIRDIKKVIDTTFGGTQQLIKSSRGVLLHGLSGCGKTMIAEAIAGSYKNAQKISIESFKVFSKFYGESEGNLRKLFEEAFQSYPKPTIILIDEISNICPKNDSSDVVRKVSALLISLLDSLHTKRNGGKIFVIATTNNLDNLDPAVRRSGRLDYEIEISVPNTQLREIILEKLLRNFEAKIDIKNIAKHTHGFVGADLENLISKSFENSSISDESILSNLSSVKPSAMRELLVEKPNVKWSDIGGMHDLKLKLKQIVEWPLLYPETFQRLGIEAPRGLCMFGPPGNSKTMIAKALATESNLNFISIKGSDLFSMWVGESEKAVRDLFNKARQLAPCICFFDEIDAIGGERESGSSVKERVLAQILTEIDGVNALKKVIIIAATNRPDLIDSALMRPGRLDRIVYVKLPDAITREEIFKIKLAKIPIDDDVDVSELVKNTEGYSGAEIESVCKEAALKALEENFNVEKISMKFFLKALEIVTPRTSAELLEIYDEFEKRK